MMAATETSGKRERSARTDRGPRSLVGMLPGGLERLPEVAETVIEAEEAT